MRQLLPGRNEILDGALAIDAGQNARRHVVDRAWRQALRSPRARSDPLQVSVPEPEGQIHKPPSSAWRTFGHPDPVQPRASPCPRANVRGTA